MVFCLPSIQAGGGTGLNLISQRKSGIPPKPPFRFSFSQTERERKQAGKNSFPPTPFLFARLLGLRPQNFSAGRRDYSSILTKQVLCKLSIVSITQIVFCTSVFKSASEI